MSEIQSTSLPLQTLSPENKPPSRRIKTANDAQTIVHTIVFANRDRARFNARVKGMLDGNPPYNPEKLKQNGQNYRANVNFMEGKASLSAALVPYYDLFAGSQHYAEVKLDLDNPDDKETKSGIATEEFDQLLKGYADFIFHMHAALHDFVGFGRGFLTWPNQWGWHFQHAPYAKVFVPDTTRASLGKVELLIVREKYELHTLWNKIKDRKSATDAGWNVTATAEAIRLAMPEQRTNMSGDVLSYDYIQQRMKDRDLVESQSGSKQPTVQVAHVLVKEFDGTVTHMIVVEPAVVGANEGGNKDGRVDFLYEKRGKFENMRQFMAAFFLETLDGSWNGARGLGHEIYAAMEISNRILCKTFDNAFLSSGITLQASDANAYQKAAVTPLVSTGNLNILPPGFNVQPGAIFAPSQPLYDAKQILDQTVSSNTGIYRAKLDKPKGNPVTATEAELKFQNATTLSNSGVSRFYQQLDPFYAELFRRVTNGVYLESDKSEEASAVRVFRARCLKRGVTLADLKKVECVRAVRNIGNGSQFQRQQALERFTPFVQLLPESGKQRWMEDLVASEFGQAAVSRYVPPRDKQLLPNDQQAYAVIENTMMKDGNMPVWTPTQNNVIHTVEHLKAMSGAAQSLEQGADPMAVLGFMEIAGPHVQTHLDKLATDPSRKSEHKMLSQQFGQIASFADQLSGHVQQQQEEQAQAQQAQMAAMQKAQSIDDGTDPETKIRAAQVAAELRLKEMKVRHGLMLKDLAAQQKAATHRQALAINDLSTAQKLQHAAAEMKLRQQQAAQKTNQP